MMSSNVAKNTYTVLWLIIRDRDTNEEHNDKSENADHNHLRNIIVYSKRMQSLEEDTAGSNQHHEPVNRTYVQCNNSWGWLKTSGNC